MKGLLFILMGLLSNLLTFSQDKYRDALDSSKNVEGPEKIYMIYDRQEYVAGETIWFSTFVFSSGRLSKTSTNLFVDLYDRNKKLLLQKRFPIFQGRSGGQLTLPISLAEDVYFVRAYTSWMRNFSEDVQYLHPFTVFNPQSAQILKPIALPWFVSAIPEGGKLIDKVPTNISIRLQSAAPLPENWHGYIVEKENKENRVPIVYVDANVGVASITAVFGSHYEAVVQDANGNECHTDLPPVMRSGIHLEVVPAADAIRYKVRIVGGQQGGAFTVLGTINNELVYEARVKTADTSFTGNIADSALSTGILRITILDPRDSVVAERLCFANRPKTNTVRLDTSTLAGQQAVFTGFRFAADTTARPFLVAVFNAGLKNPIDDDNLLSGLWLEHEVSSPIQKSAQYFQPGSGPGKALDPLLMGEKYAGLSWDALLHHQYYNAKYPPDDYLSLKGTASVNRKPLAGKGINLIFHSGSSEMSIMQVNPDSTGHFVLNHLLFYDSVNITYQVNEDVKTNRNVSLGFEAINAPFPYEKSFPEVAFSLVNRSGGDTVPMAILNRRNLVIVDSAANGRFKVMQNVTVAGKAKSKKEKLEEELSSSQFKGHNETVFDFVHENQHADYYQNILEWLQTRVSDFEIKDDGYGNKMPYMRQLPAEVFLNEIPVELDYIPEIKATDITMIKVIKGSFIGGFGSGGGGGVLIYTKRPKDDWEGVSDRTKSIVIKGFDTIDPFPAETGASATTSPSRDVFFWEPFTTTQSDGFFEIKIAPNHGRQKCKVVIAGVTPDGEPWFYNEVDKVP